MPDRINTAVKAVEPPGTESAKRSVFVDTSRMQLL